MLVAIVLEILSSQCFFASVSYVIEIIKTMIANYFSRYQDPNSFYYRYGIYIQSLVASILFVIIGLAIYSLVDYCKKVIKY